MAFVGLIASTLAMVRVEDKRLLSGRRGGAGSRLGDMSALRQAVRTESGRRRSRSGIVDDPVRRNRSEGIDLLRAGFALWVVIAHLVPWTIAAQGSTAAPAWLAGLMNGLILLFQPHGELHPAVLGFIVLSGYCIHRAGLRRPDPQAIGFYALRRGFRILPVYLLGIAAGLLGFAVASHRSALAMALSGTQRIDGACLVAKVLTIPALLPQPYRCAFLGNAPLATVMVEIVLYVLYGAAFGLLVWRGRERVIWVLCGSFFFASVVLFSSGLGTGFYDWWQDGSVFGFLPYWWLGVRFVDPGFARRVRERLWMPAAAWLALTVVLALLPTPLADGIAELRKLAFALLLGVLIIEIDNVRLHRVGAIAAIGRAGYGLYAMHAPLTYTLALYGCPWWANLAANIACGLVIHHLIERPLIDIGRRLRQRLAARPTPARAEISLR